MTRHIADRREPSNGQKTRAFWDIERKSGELHPAVRALMQKTREPVEASRLKQYLRIERGHSA